MILLGYPHTHIFCTPKDLPSISYPCGSDHLLDVLYLGSYLLISMLKDPLPLDTYHVYSYLAIL
jgi:hypothetical protein